MMLKQCPTCPQLVAETDRFCEACGHDLKTPAPASISDSSDSTTASTAAAGPAVAAARWLSSAGQPGTCPGCSGTAFGPEGYCDTCGQRRPSGLDHSELDLGVLAAVTDKGKRHHNNEDAVALVLTAHALVAVVCDGVSSSNRPDVASHGAVDAAAAALIAALERREPAGDAIGAATRAAQAAAALAGGPEPGPNPPSSTFVCAVVAKDAVTVGWVGDSRAYWLPDEPVRDKPIHDKPILDEPVYDEPACLTVDDSLAGQLAAAGRTVPDDIPRSSAAALLRWLGADAPETTPHLYAFTPTGPGRVLVCSDGLFRYRPDAADLAASTPRHDPLTTARALVQLALDAGGQDNITVAVLPYPPEESP
jgi:PPM family protein phosphatase